jgi:cytochrome b561
MKSAPSGYSGLQIALHWAIAAFIIFQLFVHDGMSDAFDDWIDGNEIDAKTSAGRSFTLQSGYPY